MPQKIRMWEVTTENSLNEISSSQINLEERLEDWLESDISMLAPDLLVIGRQVQTAFGGQVDLLCLNSNGDTVVVELKKGRTPREVTAQALDYASWVRNLFFDEITDIAERYSKLGGSLPEAFWERFEESLPDTLNQNHHTLIVAEAMDDSTERIVRYLADLNVPINVATVQHFKAQDGREMLAQVFLVESEQATGTGRTKRKPPPTLEQMHEIAIQNGVGALYDKLSECMTNALKKGDSTSTGVSFKSTFGSGKARVVFRLLPPESSKDKGLKFQLYAKRVAMVFELNDETIAELLPKERWDWIYWAGAPEDERDLWSGYEGYFQTIEEIDRFLNPLFSSKAV